MTKYKITVTTTYHYDSESERWSYYEEEGLKSDKKEALWWANEDFCDDMDSIFIKCRNKLNDIMSFNIEVEK